MITQTINLNLIPGGVLPRINVSQYDKGARTLQFNLYNGVTPFTIPDGSSVYVVGTKADRTGFDYEATYTGGLVSIDVTEQMTAFAGDVEIEIRIIKSGEQIATGNFVLCVERTALADDTVISETDIPIIQHLPELVAETEENAELAHKWATFGDESEEPSATNNAKYWAEQAEAAQDLTYDTATGNPVSFTTDSSGISKDTIVTLEPIQNLHGYGHPWPAGGGKNLLPSISVNKNCTVTGSQDDSIGCVITNTNTDDRTSFTPNLQFFDSNNTLLLTVASVVSGSSFIFPSNCSYAIFGHSGSTRDIKALLDVGDLVEGTSYIIVYNIASNHPETVGGLIINKMMFCLATETDSTFTPYSNICPISGYNEIEVNGCGVNIWDEEWEFGAINATTGANSSTNNSIRCKGYIRILPNTSYYLNFPTESDKRFVAHFYTADKSFIAPRDVRARVGVITTPSNACYMRFYMTEEYGTTYNHDVSINYPSTDTSYHAYTGHRITSPLPSTIYGGTYDVETGELTVDRALVDLGTLTWSDHTYAGNLYFKATIANIKKPSSGTVKANILCTKYEVSVSSNPTDPSISVGDYVYVRDSSFSDAATFKTAMSGVQLAYELATPYTIQLEPHLLNLFEGQNNVSTNGTQISVTYRNGIVARVDDFNAVGESFEALTGNVEIVKTDKAESSALAPVENGATASQPYAVGDYLYRNGTLFRATTAIASGATFTVDTNITATTVMAEIVRLTQ